QAMSLIEKTAAELFALQATGEATAATIADTFLDAIRDRDPRVKAFLHVDQADVRRQAEAGDAKRKAGQRGGALAGVPVADKDVVCTKRVPTTCSSKILRTFVPAYDAHVVERLKAADAVLIGKTNMDEFAMGSSTENSAYFSTRNPWDVDRIPGG